MFTKGQTVRCATDDRYYINKGQTYVVYEDSSNGYVRITDTDGDIMTYDETDFEAVEPEVMFKEGQTLRCITDQWHYVTEGKEYVVAKDSEQGFVTVFDNEGDFGSYCTEEFVLVTEAAPSFNVGDKVVMTKATSSYYKIGDVGIITHTVDQAGDYWVRFPQHDHECCVGSCEVGDNNQMALYVEPAPVAPAIEAGDSVRALHSDYPPYICVGAVLTVDSTIATDEYSRGGLYIKDRDGDALFFFLDEVELVEKEVVTPVEAGNFELTEDTPVDVAVEIKPQLSITYGGDTINLDPNMTESRMFANAVLELAYA
jgi:signal peptidase I